VGDGNDEALSAGRQGESAALFGSQHSALVSIDLLTASSVCATSPLRLLGCPANFRCRLMEELHKPDQQRN
jgi:hypothetical protein